MRFAFRSILAAAAFAATLAVIPAQAQYGYGNYGYLQRDRDDHQYYNRGLRDGEQDARHGRSARPRRVGGDRGDQQAYERGYWQGYRNTGAYANNRGGYYGNNGGYYGNAYPGYGNNGGYYGNAYPGYGGNYGGGNAAQIGFQDGINEGQKDRATGHSDRPTNSGLYQDGTHGYSSAFGSETLYKQQYRQAYLRGYQQGYKQGYGRRF